MSDFLLFLYPVTIVSILVAGARKHKTDDFLRSAWSLEQGKALQVFAALMVILHHMAQTVTNYGAVRKGPITLWNSFGILFTSVFFFFSGFGLFKSYRTKDHYLKGKEKQINRFSRPGDNLYKAGYLHHKHAYYLPYIDALPLFLCLKAKSHESFNTIDEHESIYDIFRYFSYI